MSEVYTLTVNVHSGLQIPLHVCNIQHLDDDCHHDSLRRLLIVIAEIGEWKFTNRSILIQTYLVHGTGVYTLDCIYTSIYRMCA